VKDGCVDCSVGSPPLESSQRTRLVLAMLPMFAAREGVLPPASGQELPAQRGRPPMVRSALSTRHDNALREQA
jgi:hypothetical protein